MPSSDEEATGAQVASVPGSPAILPSPKTRTAPAGASPTEVEMESWEFVTDAMLWAGFGPKFAEPATSFLDHLCVCAEDPLTEFGTMEEGDFYEALEAWEFNGAKPAAGLKNKARRLFHAARIFIKLDKNMETLKIESEAEIQHKRTVEINQSQQSTLSQETVMQMIASSQAASAQLQQQHKQTHNDIGARLVKVSDIADEMRTEEIRCIPIEKVDECLARWIKNTNAKRGPPPDIEPTAEQLSVGLHFKARGDVPYTNFALWGPYGDRTLRRIFHDGFMIGPNNTLIRQQYRGPPDVGSWEACMNVLTCMGVMIDITDQSTMQDYIKLIKGFVGIYGDVCWSIIYHADTRFRRERIVHVLRQLSAELQEALEAGGKTTFDPKRPWDACYDFACSDRFQSYWHKNVEVPCLFHLNNIKAGSVNTYTNGDAAISANVQDHLPSASGGHSENYITPKGNPGGGGKRQKAQKDHYRGDDSRNNQDYATGRPQKGMALAVGIHRDGGAAPAAAITPKIVNGSWNANRAGIPMCPGFQNGSCKGACPNGMTHQCSKCLDNSHGQYGPPRCSKPLAQAVRTKGNKGKGKGKGKSKRT